jgi:hypothetical protein
MAGGIRSRYAEARSSIVFMGAVLGCAAHQLRQFHVFPSQGEAALPFAGCAAFLCLGFELDAFDLAYGETNATAKKGGFELPILPPAAEGHWCDFPTGCEISGG